MYVAVTVCPGATEEKVNWITGSSFSTANGTLLEISSALWATSLGIVSTTLTFFNSESVVLVRLTSIAEEKVVCPASSELLTVMPLSTLNISEAACASEICSEVKPSSESVSCTSDSVGCAEDVV